MFKPIIKIKHNYQITEKSTTQGIIQNVNMSSGKFWNSIIYTSEMLYLIVEILWGLDKVYFNGSNQWCLIKTWFERYTYSVWSKRLGRFQSDSVVKVVCKCS